MIEKKQARASARAVRAQCDAALCALHADAMTAALRAAYPQVRTYGIYFPLHDEFDVLPIAERLSQAGAVTALPVLQPDKDLQFARWRCGDPAEFDASGVPRPFGRLRLETPELLLVPLLAFTAQGDRLGYGGGSYDRYLARCTVLTVGVAYSAQEVAALPAEPHDVRMNAILTEAGLRVSD